MPRKTFHKIFSDSLCISILVLKVFVKIQKRSERNKSAKIPKAETTFSQQITVCEYRWSRNLKFGDLVLLNPKSALRQFVGKYLIPKGRPYDVEIFRVTIVKNFWIRNVEDQNFQHKSRCVPKFYRF